MGKVCVRNKYGKAMNLQVTSYEKLAVAAGVDMVDAAIVAKFPHVFEIVEETVSEEVVDEPVIDEPVIDEPVIDEPVIDEPVIDDEVPKPKGKGGRKKAK